VGTWARIISTGTGEVGINREQIRGVIKDLWEGGGAVIAKGMGNYETISQFDPGRSVIHIMKVKCSAVAEDVGYPWVHISLSCVESKMASKKDYYEILGVQRGSSEEEI
jgi:uncharacterized protein with ATP-grasp and redox domains